MKKALLKTFFGTLVVGVGAVVLMRLIGYLPPNPRIFNAVDHITFIHFFENRIYDNWIMIAFLFALGVTLFDAVTDRVKK